MKLEILSFDDALKFKPEVKTYPIRITHARDAFSWMSDMVESDNWVRDVKKSWYNFDDTWPNGFNEYRDRVGFTEINRKILLDCNCPIKDGGFEIKRAREILSSMGSHFGREVLFDHDLAQKIYSDFEEHKNNVEQVMVHCQLGANRSPAVGIAMNEHYGWGIKGLKEKFPHHRRFVYDIMKEVGEEF